jgi:hypothetical protein
MRYGQPKEKHVWREEKRQVKSESAEPNQQNERLPVRTSPKSVDKALSQRMNKNRRLAVGNHIVKRQRKSAVSEKMIN